MLTSQQEAKIEYQLKILTDELNTRIERQRQKEQMTQRIEEYTFLLREIKEEETHFKQARLFAIKYQNNKKLKDAEMIKKAMSTASKLVLQKNHNTPEFVTPPNRRYPESNLVIKRGDRIVKLESSEGTGVAESVSSLTLLSVLQSTPFAKISLLDEYFSSVSPLNSENLSRNLNELIDDKIQLVMIEQKDEVFKHASYREFYVKHNGVESYVETYDVTIDDNGEKHRVLVNSGEEE